MKLAEVIPWGRSLDEYRRMFALTEGDLTGTVLGCGDGPASFNAEATVRGHAVVSCDPIYAFTAHEIQQRVEACYDDVISQVERERDGFVWTDYRDPDHLGACRLAAMRSFLDDFEPGKADGRYVTASLPRLPFHDGQFDLALCSHLLFLYSDRFGIEFHRAAIDELLRVAREVRIFPLLRLDRQVSPYIAPLQIELTARGFQAEVRPASYEFQRGGNQMLAIRANKVANTGGNESGHG